MVRHHEVPTHLDVEDKVLFGLTVRQFLHLLVGSSGTYLFWDQTAGLNEAVRVGMVCISVCTTVVLALIRPAGRPLEEWLAVTLLYIGTPRRATWQPGEPAVSDWRPAGAAWQELTPSLTWADGSGEESEWV